MFARYLELRSVHLLQRELQQQGVRSRFRPQKDGRTLGGMVLGRGAISHMLKNPLYIGLIRHAGELHDGQHEAIVDRAVFDQVQGTLTQSGPGEAARSKRGSPALLKGLVFDADGSRMQPTHAVKNGVRYRYYTSARRLRAAREDPGGIRVPAGDLERIGGECSCGSAQGCSLDAQVADEPSACTRASPNTGLRVQARATPSQAVDQRRRPMSDRSLERSPSHDHHSASASRRMDFGPALASMTPTDSALGITMRKKVWTVPHRLPWTSSSPVT